MKPLFTPLLAVTAAATLSGGPAEQAIIAAMKLAEQPSYSWNSTVIDDARSYEIEGKTVQAGFTWLRLPMVKSIARRLGREADCEIEAIFNRQNLVVIRTDRGWRTLRELPKERWSVPDDVELWPALPSARAGAGTWPDPLAAPDPFSLPPLVMHRFPREETDNRPYSNAQFALCHPHDELAVIVSSFIELKCDGGVISGTLSELGAQLLLVRDGLDEIKPLAAAGVFRLHVKDGIVVRYQLRLEGILQLERKRKVHVHQLSTTSIAGIGSTQFEVPADARQRLVALR